MPAPLSTISIGAPDIAVMIPDTCQFEKSERSTVERRAKAERGKSHRKLRTKRCVRSKSDDAAIGAVVELIAEDAAGLAHRSRAQVLRYE